jgi:putative endonuclease
MREYHVYILASRPRGTLYVGVSSSLEGRVAQHRAGATHSFTRQYGVHRLVHVETFSDPREAIPREKRLKKWPRAWKLELIEAANPTWRDLLEG